MLRCSDAIERNVSLSFVKALAALFFLLASAVPFAHAQTAVPDVLWQRGIFDYLHSLTWASNGLIYAADRHSFLGGGPTALYIDVYRASDLTYVRGLNAFSAGAGYDSGEETITSTGYPGHIVIVATGYDKVMSSGQSKYKPFLRLYREDLTLLQSVDLTALPGSGCALTDYPDALKIVFSADGNRLAVSGSPPGRHSPFQTLYFDTSQRESGNVGLLAALPGVHPVFPTSDIPFTDFGILNATNYLWVEDGQLQSYDRYGKTDVKAYFNNGYNFPQTGEGYPLGFIGYMGYGPWLIAGKRLWNPAPWTTPDASGSASSLPRSPLPADSGGGWQYSGDMVTKLIRWNGAIAPNERLFLGGTASPNNSAEGEYGFIQVYDMDYPSVFTQKLSFMQIQTDPTISAQLWGFTPSFDSSAVVMSYVGVSGGNYLQVKGIHNETLTPREVGLSVTATALSPDGTTLAAVRAAPAELVLYRTSDAKPIASAVLPQALYPTHIQFSKDGKYVATFFSILGGGIGNSQNPVLIYRVSDGALVNRIDLTVPGTSRAFAHLAVSPDFSIIAGEEYNGSLYLYHPATATFTNFPQNTFPVAFSPDSSAFVSGKYQAELRDIQTGQQRWKAPYTGQSIDALVFSPDGSTIALDNPGEGVKLLRATDGTLKQTVSTTLPNYGGTTEQTTNLGFLPNGALFTLAPDNAINVWDTASGTQLRNYRPTGIGSSTLGIFNLAVSPNGQYFAYVTDSYLLNVAKAPYYGQNVQIGAGGLAAASRSATDVSVTFSVKNFGKDPAEALTFTKATLGPANTPTTSALPKSVAGGLAAGNTKSVKFTFPLSALNGTVNGVATLRVNGTYIGGTFTLSQRIVVP